MLLRLQTQRAVLSRKSHHLSVASFTVSVARKTKISEIFYDESDYADKWYLVKVNFITLDEKSGKEKKSASFILVQAGDFENALGRFQDGMKGTMADYEIASIAETKYMEVFPYEFASSEENS